MKKIGQNRKNDVRILLPPNKHLTGQQKKAFIDLASEINSKNTKLPINNLISREISNLNGKLDSIKSDFSVFYNCETRTYELRAIDVENTNQTMEIGTIYDDCLATDYALWIDPAEMTLISNFIKYLRENEND